MLARLNIENFPHLLETETDPAKQDTLNCLLAQEEAKLKALTKPEKRRRQQLLEAPRRSKWNRLKVEAIIASPNLRRFGQRGGRWKRRMYLRSGLV